MERRAALKAALEALHKAAVDDQGEARSFTDAENTEFDTKVSEIRALDERISELQEAEKREAAAAAHRVEIGTADREERVAPATVVSEPVTYRKGDNSTSFFADLARQNTDSEARDRLVRNTMEQRALSTTANAGGQFAPPLWLIDEFVALAKAGRVTADLVQHEALPSGVSSINLPTVATGTSVAAQGSQNTAVSMTDLTTGSVSASINTIAGQQQVSLQLLSQSGISFDRVVLEDLARAYAIALDSQVITSIAGVSGANAQTYTNASPAVVGAGQFYSQVLQAANSVATNRLAPANVVVMHPRRWSWVLNALDTQNRPLVVPNGPSFNQLAQTDGGSAVTAIGAAGTLLGMPVYVDPNIPTNLGAGTNQDEVFVMKADDLWLYETPLTAASFDATYANQLTVLYRVHAFNAFLPNRFPKAISIISGTGLVAPTF
jgi:HK97 family phage major capsid protein